MRLSIAIAHHPAREDTLARLLDQIMEQRASRHVAVVTDPEPERRNTWLNVKEAWRLGITSKAPHHLVLENDVILCDDFYHRACQALREKPAALVRFYVADVGFSHDVRSYREADQEGKRWHYSTGHWGCAQAVAMPTSWVEDFLHWAESYPALGKSPDDRLRPWAYTRKHSVLATIPSLVQHARGPSLAGNAPHEAIRFA